MNRSEGALTRVSFKDPGKVTPEATSLVDIVLLDYSPCHIFPLAYGLIASAQTSLFGAQASQLRAQDRAMLHQDVAALKVSEIFVWLGEVIELDRKARKIVTSTGLVLYSYLIICHNHQRNGPFHQVPEEYSWGLHALLDALLIQNEDPAWKKIFTEMHSDVIPSDMLHSDSILGSHSHGLLYEAPMPITPPKTSAPSNRARAGIKTQAPEIKSAFSSAILSWPLDQPLDQKGKKMVMSPGISKLQENMFAAVASESSSNSLKAENGLQGKCLFEVQI